MTASWAKREHKEGQGNYFRKGKEPYMGKGMETMSGRERKLIGKEGNHKKYGNENCITKEIENT